MRALKYIAAFLSGFICAVLLIWYLILPKENQTHFDYGFTNGVMAGRREAVGAIQKEFGTCDGHITFKYLFGADNNYVVSIATNGIKTIRTIQ